MKIRFQADADLNQIIVLATIRNEPAIDFQTSFAGGLVGLKDKDVLALAAKDKRVLVTHDRRTMPKYFYEFITADKSPGLIVIPQYLSIASAVENLILLWSATDDSEWINRICFLPL
ncbi:MAG: DUF5615 family PIN-like protein [Bacteroidetes bacterium]|nr:DUF5615 family PIN-like protein [Bacteroidota bacterium]MBU1421805.1 DUF5615 family PIN-like protein [Bacteroidota bacterium]MBU2636776.1 DUF5615 family PIN-like protein [Bacteroidota bacterium]